MALNALYRITSGEVLVVSTSAITPPDSYTANYAPASTPDGESLSAPKIKDGTAMRNATSGEIAGFGAFTVTDIKAGQKVLQKTWYDSANASYEFRLRALMLQARDEINTIRTNVVLGLSSISEATWISNVKSKLDSES